MITELQQNRLDEKVTITCYNQVEVMNRGEALEKYYEGMCCSEGSEHERYETIFFQLMQGRMECSDQVDFR